MSEPFVEQFMADFYAESDEHLATLRRSVSGKFDVAEAKPLADILSLSATELEKRVIPFLKLAAA